jgi:hypothetical protein
VGGRGKEENLETTLRVPPTVDKVRTFKRNFESAEQDIVHRLDTDHEGVILQR